MIAWSSSFFGDFHIAFNNASGVVVLYRVSERNKYIKLPSCLSSASLAPRQRFSARFSFGVIVKTRKLEMPSDSLKLCSRLCRQYIFNLDTNLSCVMVARSASKKHGYLCVAVSKTKNASATSGGCSLRSCNKLFKSLPCTQRVSFISLLFFNASVRQTLNCEIIKV